MSFTNDFLLNEQTFLTSSLILIEYIWKNFSQDF